MTSSTPHPIRLPHSVRNFQCTSENSPVPCKMRYTTPPATSTSEIAKSVVPPLEVLSLLDSLSDAVAELEQRRAASLSELQVVAIELAVAIATTLTGRAIQHEDYDISQLTTQLLQELPLKPTSRLHVHPDDLTQLQSLSSQPIPLDLRPAADVGRGNCRLEDDSGRLVISNITRRLEVIRQDWLEELKNAQIERRQIEESDRALQRFPDRRGTA